jgi:hypothetical protein
MLVNRLYVDFRNVDEGLAELLRALQLERSSKTKFSELPTQKQKDDRFPATELKDRRIDSAVPSQAEVGQRIDLLVQVRFPDSPLLGREDWPTKTKPDHVEQTSESVPLEFPVDPRTGKLGAARLEVQIVAPDFEIAGTARQRLLVPPEEYSKCLAFLITPKKTGVCRINVEIYNTEQIFLGAIPIETEVGGEMKAPSTNVANLFLLVTVGQENTAMRSGAPLKPKEIPPPAPAPSQTATGVDIGGGGDIAIGGDVVGRDKIIVMPSAKRTSIGKSLTLWLGIVATVATIITGIFQLIPDAVAPKSGRFFGEVKYKGTDKGVEGAEIVVQSQMNGPVVGKKTTGAKGAFDFTVKTNWEETVWVTVSLGDSVGFEGSLTLAGNQEIPFEPFKKKP